MLYEDIPAAFAPEFVEGEGDLVFWNGLGKTVQHNDTRDANKRGGYCTMH